MSNTNLPAAAGKVTPTAIIKRFAQELGMENDLRLVKNDAFNEFLNLPPRPEWIKKHPTATREILDQNGFKTKTPILHIPINRTKLNLSIIFGDWDWEITDYKVIANAISVSGRLTVTHPLTGKTMKRDGVGAVAIQVKKGSSPTDFTAINSDAIHKNLPAAEAYALKSAARKFGRIFGSELNIDDNWEFGSLYADKDETGHVITDSQTLSQLRSKFNLEGVQ